MLAELYNILAEMKIGLRQTHDILPRCGWSVAATILLDFTLITVLMSINETQSGILESQELQRVFIYFFHFFYLLILDENTAKQASNFHVVRKIGMFWKTNMKQNKINFKAPVTPYQLSDKRQATYKLQNM